MEKLRLKGIHDKCKGTLSVTLSSQQDLFTNSSIGLT